MTVEGGTSQETITPPENWGRGLDKQDVELYCITSITSQYITSCLVRNLLRPRGHREDLVKALPRELVKAPLRAYPVHLGDLEEGLNRRGARNLEDSD